MIKSFTIIISVGFLIALLIWTRPDIQAELQPLPPTRVYTESVKVMDIQPVTKVTGKLQPARKTSLRFEVSGKVTQRFVEPGQRVSSGEVLLQIEQGDYEDNVVEADADLDREIHAINRDKHLLELIVNESEVSKRELNRLEQLGQESLASKSNYDEALQRLLQRQAEEARLRHSVDIAAARIKTKRAVLNKAQRNLDRTRLVAPFTGTVNAVTVEVGDFAASGQVAIELVELDTLDLYIEVTGSVVYQLSLGQTVMVEASSKTYQGTIIAIASDPDPDTHTHAVRIRLTANGLYSGQLAEAELPGQFLTQALVVPVSSILREDGKSYVFKVNGNHIERHQVELLQRYKQLQVINGIEPDTQIISRDVGTLANGQEVIVNKKI